MSAPVRDTFMALHSLWKRTSQSVDCPSCGGYGDHGIEEESGCAYVCYRCGGDGFVPVSEVATGVQP